MFVDEADYRLYLDSLEEWKTTLGCKLYAFCLMTNHVHLVIDPGDDPISLGLLMKRLAGRYTRYVNRIEGRSGTVWNGRFKSSPVETDRYLMACCRYVELNPVRAGMVASPEQYRWSSFNDKIGPSVSRLLDEDAGYIQLGATRAERAARYREWIRASVPEGEWERIQLAVRRGQLTGGVLFQEVVERCTCRRIEFRGRGRPRKDRSERKLPLAEHVGEGEGKQICPRYLPAAPSISARRLRAYGSSALRARALR